MLCFSFLFLKEIVSSDDKSSEEILEFKNRRRDFDAVGEEKEEEEKDISKRFEDNACIGPDRNPTRFRRSVRKIRKEGNDPFRNGKYLLRWPKYPLFSSFPGEENLEHSLFRILLHSNDSREKSGGGKCETMKNSSTIPNS